MTNNWNVPEQGEIGYIEDSVSGQVLSILKDDTNKDAKVILEEKVSPVSERQMWRRSMDTAGYFTLTSPLSGKILLAESPMLITAKGKIKHSKICFVIENILFFSYVPTSICF